MPVYNEQSRVSVAVAPPWFFDAVWISLIGTTRFLEKYQFRFLAPSFCWFMVVNHRRLRTIVQTADTMRRASFVALALLVIMLLCEGRACCLTGNGSAPPDLQACHYSNQVYENDASLMRKRAPAHFALMASRFVQVGQAVRGRACTGTATVAFNGHKYVQAGLSDDPGLVWLIPTISHWTGMSVADVFDLTAFALISLAVLTGYAGFSRLYPDDQVRWAGAAVFLCLGIAQAKVADVYIFQTAPLIGGIPWVLYFALRHKLFALNASMTLFVFCSSWCSLVRSGTTTICLAFLIPLLAGCYRVRKMLLPVLLIILACLPSIIFKRFQIAHRDAILAGTGETATAVNSHPIWHSIYIGLGFIPNSQVPEYSDAVAIDKVRSIDPTAPYTSAKYELILEREVLKIAKQRPALLIENLAAKTGIVILLAAILLFPAKRLLFAEKEIIWLDTSFVLAITLSAMNAILVIPKPAYLLTFLCLTFLYSFMKLCRRRFLDAHASDMSSQAHKLYLPT
jgi:hypothetical protein